MLRDTSAASTSSKSTVSARAPPPMPPVIAAMQTSAAAMTLRFMRPPLRLARFEPRRRPLKGATPELCGVITHAGRRHRRACDADRAGSDDLRHRAARDQGDHARSGRVDRPSGNCVPGHQAWAADRLHPAYLGLAADPGELFG